MLEKNTHKLVWSYSSLSLYKQCPQKYYRLRVKKDVVEPESDAMRYGTAVHKAAEDFIKHDTPIPAAYSFLQKPLTVLKEKDGEKLCEYKMGLTRNLEACGFFDKQVWWRGVADLVVLQPNRAYVVDYKTGKSSRYADTKQLEMMALGIFKHFPQVQMVKSGLLFVVAHDFVKEDFKRDDEAVHWRAWLEDVTRLEKAVQHDVWNARPNFTCKKWCPVKDCVHHGTSQWR